MNGLRPFLLLFPLALAGCGILDIRDDARDQYEKALKRWEASGPNDYIATMERRCFCAAEARGPVRVTVSGTTVLSRVYEDTGEAVPSEFASLFPTVDGLFDIIDDALDRGAYDVQAFYDPLAGVPFSFYIDYDQNTVDEELGFQVDLPLEYPGN